MWRDPHPYMQDGWNAGHVVVMMILMVLLWTLIALAALAIIRYVRSNREPIAETKSTAPADILRMRLAKGEVDPAEFAARMAALEGHS